MKFYMKIELTLKIQYALESGGPVGALLAYLVIGVVVYALCVSVGEMVAYLFVHILS